MKTMSRYVRDFQERSFKDLPNTGSTARLPFLHRKLNTKVYDDGASSTTSKTSTETNDDSDSDYNYNDSDSSDSESWRTDSFPSAEKNNNFGESEDFEVKPNLCVEEIFACGLAEWSRAREEVRARRERDGKLPPVGPNLMRSGRGPNFDRNYDANFDAEVEEILRPNRRKLFDIVKKASAEEETAETFASGEKESMLHFQHVIRQLRHHRQRATKTASATESEEVTKNDASAHYKRRMTGLRAYARDALRVVVVLLVSFVLTGLPWLLEDGPPTPPSYKFNLTESNICFWAGNASIFDPMNPCPYRGYNAKDDQGNDCLRWKDVMENEKWVAAMRAEKEKQAGVVLSEYLERVKRLAELYDGEDYGSPFCRRFYNFEEGKVYKRSDRTKCFVIKGKDGTRLEVPRLSDCWIVPCTLRISNQCLKSYWRNQHEREKQEIKKKAERRRKMMSLEEKKKRKEEWKKFQGMSKKDQMKELANIMKKILSKKPV